MNFILAIWMFVVIFLYVANLCYVKQLEHEMEYLRHDLNKK